MSVQSTRHLEYSFSMTRQEVEWTALDKHVLVTQRISLQESSRNGWLEKGSPVHGRYWLRLWGTVNLLYWLTRLKRVRCKCVVTLFFLIFLDPILFPLFELLLFVSFLHIGYITHTSIFIILGMHFWFKKAKVVSYIFVILVIQELTIVV